jgi:hypothetical protein
MGKETKSLDQVKQELITLIANVNRLKNTALTKQDKKDIKVIQDILLIGLKKIVDYQNKK